MTREQLSDVLSEFARTVVTDVPIQGILDHLVKRIVEIMPVSAAGVTLIATGLDPPYVAASSASALRYEQLQADLGEGPCLAAYETGEAIAVPNLRSEDRFPNFSPRALDAGLAAVFTFPLHHDDRQQGALDLYRDTPGPLSAESMGTAQTLADVAAAYLLNAQARDDLQVASERPGAAALRDAVTGLPNRILMLERLEQAFLREHRSSTISAVLFVDLNRFGAITDTVRHRVGDELLVAVGKRLAGILRPGDTLARVSEDGFLILCEDLADPSQAAAIAARIDAAMALPFAVPGVEVNFSASIGIAFTGRGDDAPEQLIREANLAMYQIKRQCAGGPSVFDLRALERTADQDGLEDALPGAVERGELALAFQPIVAGRDGRLTAVEALLRWSHPSRGSVSPTVLIALAEQAGLITEIGRWVLEQALSERRHWRSPRAEELAVSVNVSAHQFMSTGFTDTVAAILDTTSADPGCMTLEVTGSVFARDSERARIVLSDLKEIGVMIALDDFGSGYSSLSYLRQYPLDTIKIDQSFIADLGREATSRTIIEAVLDLAHGLGMTVVGKGVETRRQHHELTELGCDCCQGYYFAAPMSSSSLRTLIQSCTDIHPRLPLDPAATGG